MFSQFFVQIFALYKFFRKNLRKKRRKFSMDPIWMAFIMNGLQTKWRAQPKRSEAEVGLGAY